MARLNKLAFKHYVETECDRRLLWDLAEADPALLSPYRELVEPDFERHEAARLGHVWEQQVYRALRQLPGARAELDQAGEVLPRKLDGRSLGALHADASAGPLILLEHEATLPESFYRFLVDAAADGPMPVTLPDQNFRPDVLLVSSTADDAVAREVLPDGRLRVLSPDERRARLSLRVLDVKHTSEHGVGRSHFVELLFYAHGLSHWLRAQRLADRFFVSADGHGILPFIDDPFAGLTLEKLTGEFMVPLVWDDARVLFERATARVRDLVSRRPHDPDAVDVRVQPACGACRYLNDCKISLERGSTDPGDWDLRLIPYTSPTTAGLLRSLEKLDTVRDVATSLAVVPPSSGYDPIYAERPMLRLRARALMEQQRVAAHALDLGGQRHLSMALPRYSDMTLLVDLESDPTHDVVFGAALRLEITCAPNAAHRDLYDAWWDHFRLLLESNASAAVMIKAAHGLRPSLDEAFLRDAGVTSGAADELIAEASHALSALHDSGKLELLSRDDDPGAPLKARWTWRYVAGDVTPLQEFELAQDLLNQLSACVTLCNAMESLVGVIHPVLLADGRTWNAPSAPSLAIFYWSSDQVQHAQDMLERQVDRIHTDPTLRRRFEELLQWLAPTESGVVHATRHQKLFDLRSFVETTQGLPHVINCTWHGMLKSDFRWSVSSRYWAPHFNYMDYAVWHSAIEEGNQNKRNQKLTQIGDQLEVKLQGLERILQTVRSEMRESLMLREAIQVRRMRQTLPLGGLHAIARTWYMFARLNATAAQLSVDDVRYSYPSKGIGRLYAAEVTALQPLPPDEDMPHGGARFELHGMSAEVRFKEGDRALLVPESKRAKSQLKEWGVELVEMRYDAARRCYECVVAASEKDFGAELSALGDALTEDPIYLYPTAMDIWSGRLLDNKNGLLRRWSWRTGHSWLGFRASMLMGLHPEPALPPPPSLTFSMAETYLYAPTLLPTGRIPDHDPLRTTVSPPPDASQQEAIRLALGSTITCLQGPPGTGKSQTLAALVDEFVLRADGPVRVLVTAFSYDAMVVLARKLSEHRDAQQQPTAAAKLPLVFMLSGDREVPVPGAHGLTIHGATMTLDGVKVERTGGRRLEDALPPSFVMFANAHSLFKLTGPSTAAKFTYDFLKNDTGFDLIIVDEASQLPTDHFLAAAEVLWPGEVTLGYTDATPDYERPVPRLLESMAIASMPARRTRVVVVGDQHQLPPVQQVKPPRKLRKVLGSLFHYFLEGHRMPAHQLQVNYRSTDTIVDYTRTLGIYTELRAFRKERPYALLPEVPSEVTSPWVRAVLDPSREVHTLVHRREGERATSPLEATLAAEVVAGFFAQMGVKSAAEERAFWAEHVGVVAPHNAQGRQIIREIKARLGAGEGAARRSSLDDAELDRCLRQTVYSVEKFQGSDRTFIVASMGISARDQLMAEEEFIYGLSRFNVLTSRAKQKMLLLCSRTFLDYIPGDRDIMACASRIRSYAMDFCDRESAVEVLGETGAAETLSWRYREG